MLLPLTGIPEVIKNGLEPYRELFCRDAGFDHVSRYITGLLLSPNKTLQGIHDQQVWPEAAEVSRRAMHAGVFEAGWDSEGLLPRHREVVAGDHDEARPRCFAHVSARQPTRHPPIAPGVQHERGQACPGCTIRKAEEQRQTAQPASKTRSQPTRTEAAVG